MTASHRDATPNRRRARICSAVLAVGVLLSAADCAAGARTSTKASLPPGVEAISLLGDTLRTLPLSAETRKRYERQLAEARGAYEHTPGDPDSIIWYARRLGYLGRLREAIAVYTRGIEQHPDNPGSTATAAIATSRSVSSTMRSPMEHAAKLVEGKPDVVEPDGRANARNTPIGTLHSNIDYHLALAYYLKGDYEKALPIYRRDIAKAGNADRLASTSHWLYMSLRRSGRSRRRRCSHPSSRAWM
jgi:tetratricopeptide (TPR) repeat protein